MEGAGKKPERTDEKADLLKVQNRTTGKKSSENGEPIRDTDERVKRKKDLIKYSEVTGKKKT